MYWDRACQEVERIAVPFRYDHSVDALSLYNVGLRDNVPDNCNAPVRNDKAAHEKVRRDYGHFQIEWKTAFIGTPDSYVA